jgi:hypothetical protein
MSLERIRDYVEGRLAPEEREAFALEMGRDPVLAEMVETYELVLRATSDPAPGAATAIGDVIARAGEERRSRLPALALAAALLLAAVGGLLLLRRPAAEPVVLTAIPLALLESPEAPDWPRELLDHATADEDGLVWYEDLETAQRLARAANAPIFLFVHFPGCPWCDEFRAKQAKDPAVIRAADAFVLLQLDWRKAPPELRADPSQGWPLFDLLDADGKRIDGFKGLEPASKVAAWLEKRAPAPRPDWVGLGEGARRLDLAERAEGPAARYASYRQVAAADNVLGKAARARLLGMEKEAQRALFAARDAFGRLGSAAAADRLGAAAQGLRGTPYADDLEKVLVSLREHGSFPELKE